MVGYIVGLRLKYKHLNIFGYGIFMVIFTTCWVHIFIFYCML